MVQSPSWEANWFAASQEIPRISRNPKVSYRTHKRPPPVSILSQPNPVHIPTLHILEIHPKIIHPSTPRSPQWSPSLRFHHQDPIQYIYIYIYIILSDSFISIFYVKYVDVPMLITFPFCGRLYFMVQDGYGTIFILQSLLTRFVVAFSEMVRSRNKIVFSGCKNNPGFRQNRFHLH